jgi:ABC-type lipoprotein export system ATPase subunit
MTADTAILSSSPIILIDEIENAGIDRKRALELLVKEDKIVLIATHDPVLALIGERRIIISNGGISQVIETTEDEREVLGELERMDKFIQDMRTKLRYGKKLKKRQSPFQRMFFQNFLHHKQIQYMALPIME